MYANGEAPQSSSQNDILTLPLLRYDPPITRSEAFQFGKLPSSDGEAAKRGQQLAPLTNKPMITPTADVLNHILPPKEEGDWVQFVSNAASTRYDVRGLQEQFDMKLSASKARKSGICPVRNSIYSECFDELIRQVTVDCAERGLLLLRVRDEIRMTTAAYRTLYETSVDFGKKKAVEAERGKQEMLDKIDALSQEKGEMDTQVRRLTAKMRAMEKNVQEQQQADEKKHLEELSFLQRTNQRLKQQEETLKNMQKMEREAMMAGSN